MRTLRFLALAIAVLALSVPVTRAENSSNPAWDKMKSLVGEWGGSEDGKPFHVSYKMVSGGTALMETLDGPDALQMVTIYHPDGDTILMTHYCSMGNQPRMRATSLDKDKLAFSYVDATNIRSADEMRMTHLVLTFADADHLGEDWTHKAGGKEETGHFTWTRKK